jgi:hypothetical protein
MPIHRANAEAAASGSATASAWRERLVSPKRAALTEMATAATARTLSSPANLNKSIPDARTQS